MYDDPPGDMRAMEPDVRKAKAIGALIIRAGIEIDVDRTVVAVVDGRGGRTAGDEAAGRYGPDAVGAGYSRRARARATNRWPRGTPAVLPVSASARQSGYQASTGCLLHRRIGRRSDVPQSRIGAHLLAHAEAEARAAGIARMALCTGVSNPAQHLHERAGYRIVETRRHADYERITHNPGRVPMIKDLG